MNKSQVILKKISADQLFTISSRQSFSKTLKKDLRCKSAANCRSNPPMTTITIKQKNTQLSKKTYSNLKIFKSLSKANKKLKSTGQYYNQALQNLDSYKRKSQQLYRHKLSVDNPQQTTFFYKPFPKRESFIKNNNAVKFFYQPNNKNYNVINFLSQDFYIDIKLSQNSFYQKSPKKSFIQKIQKTPKSKRKVQTNPQSYISQYSSTNSINKPLTADHKNRRIIYNKSGTSKYQTLAPWEHQQEQQDINNKQF